MKNMGQRRKEKHYKYVESCRAPLGLPSSHLEGFPEGSKVGFPPSLRMASESEGRAGTSVRTRAPTVRKPSQDLHNKTMEPSLRMLVLINNIKEKVQ